MMDEREIDITADVCILSELRLQQQEAKSKNECHLYLARRTVPICSHHFVCTVPISATDIAAIANLDRLQQVRTFPHQTVEEATAYCFH